ncbi:MAG: fumarylacetoacetate hydrolase family protein [Pseudomonadota bacterium]
MRIARAVINDEIWVGTVDVDSSRFQCRLRDDASSGKDAAIELIALTLDGSPLPPALRQEPLDAARLLSPIRQPSKNVICIGKNYSAHAEEFAGSGYDSSAGADSETVPSAPILFSKAPSSLVGPRDPVEVPWHVTSEIDYEAELGLVIGRGGRHIARDDAYDHVWGYTVINDVTARDLQSRHKQWLLGKSIDTFCPMGPYIVSADELDPESLELNCWVNGELRQQANTKDLVFDIPEILAAVSASMTLQTGDIVATGTPAGVGIGFSPPRFLRKGDRVRVEISGIGTIENEIS